ncbi:MAG: BACON domain-containing protein, partial [Bryobacterales bacterium]|nr:BACON domain-containing protein [Bryobacterales bacterium]
RKLTRAATYTLSSPSQIFSAVGGTGSVGVTVNPTGVPWNAFSLADWVTLTGPTTGTANATINFLVQPNTASTARTTSIWVAGEVFTITQQAAPGAGMRFVPLTPCRLVDTRAAYSGPRIGAFGPPLLAAGSTRTIPILSSLTCAIPANAKAYVFNITLDTVENSTGPVDTVTVYPTGETQPEYYTARTTTGGYIANSAIVKAGTGGSVNVYVSNNVNFILDISGYFTDDPAAPGLLYYPVSPCRAVDTRMPPYGLLPPPYGQSRLQAGENRSLRLPGSAGCSLPAAGAYSLQLTLAPGDVASGAPVAFLTAYPTGVPQPSVSNMNALSGFAVANSAIVPANTAGSIDVFAYNATNLIIDVNGYFAPDDGTGRGLKYYPVRQCRPFNTQDATLPAPFGAPIMTSAADRSIPLPSSGRCTDLPIDARSWALNASVVPNGSAIPYLSLWPTGSAWPNVSQLNAFQGQTLANSGIVPAGTNGSVDLRVAGTAHTIVEVAGYFAR